MTAKEFLKTLPKDSNWELSSIVENAMIEFAKYHVEQALKEVNNKRLLRIESGYGRVEERNPLEPTNIVSIRSDYGRTYYGHGDSSYDYITVDESSIINAYPLENIK